MFLIFLGLTKKVEALTHHNLYLANRWEEHFASIFDNPDWPKNPSYYIHCPSQLDKTLAPEGHEIVVIGVPVAPGLDDSDSQRQEFAEQAIKHLESPSTANVANSFFMSLRAAIVIGRAPGVPPRPRARPGPRQKARRRSTWPSC